MDRQALMHLLAERIPVGADDILVTGEQVHFSMPDGWEPSDDSGIFEVHMNRAPIPNRWQYRR